MKASDGPANHAARRPHIRRLGEQLLQRLASDQAVLRRSVAERRAERGLMPWGRHYLPNHFTRPASRMHRWLAGHLDAMADARGRRINVLGPRGGAKSTVVSLAYVLRAALEAREPYIWIVSDTRHQACAHLENVRAELIDNERIAADYPNAAGRGPTWRSNLLVLRNGGAIEALGAGQRIRGRRRREHRPTLIVCDDLQNDGHMHSALARERSRTWFHGSLLKAGTARTNVVNLATALHGEALALELHRTPGWTSRIFRAIERWPENMSLWHDWEAIYTDVANAHASRDARAFYDDRREAMDRGAAVLWPEVEDLYALMCMRAESGPAAFEREKQNSPIRPDLCEWPEEYFDERVWFAQWPGQLRVKTLAIDPSKGTDAKRSDYSALVMVGVDSGGMIYVEADIARRPMAQIVADGVEAHRLFQPDALGIEANQFQELLGAEFDAEFRRRGLLAARPWLLNNQVNKLVRIRRLGPYLAARRMRFKDGSGGTRLLVEQLKEFPAGDYDDGPDAAEMAIRMAAELLSPAVDDGLGNRLRV